MESLGFIFYKRKFIEAVITRRSWKPFAQKAQGFESLNFRQAKPKSNTKVFGLGFIFLVKTANAYMQ